MNNQYQEENETVGSSSEATNDSLGGSYCMVPAGDVGNHNGTSAALFETNLIERLLCFFLRGVLEAIPTVSNVPRIVMQSLCLRNMVGRLKNFAHEGKLSAMEVGFVYNNNDQEKQHPPDAGLVPSFVPHCTRVLKEPLFGEAAEGKEAFLCAVAMGSQGEALDEQHVDTAVTAEAFEIRHHSQFLRLMQIPMALDPVVLWGIRSKIKIYLNDVFSTRAGPQEREPRVPAALSFDPTRVQPYDIMCDRRDPRCASHLGNRRFAVLVNSFMEKHSDKNMLIIADRAKVSKAVVRAARNCYPGGRFLAKTKRETWKDIGDKLAIRWVSLIIKKKASAALGNEESDASA